MKKKNEKNNNNIFIPLQSKNGEGEVGLLKSYYSVV
jgi:hypothetical protein